jgi:HAD superfamily hydrolase (TIGR01509 family)
MGITPPFAPAAVVFDLDGVLVDSEDLWADVEREVISGYGIAWDPDVQQIMHGKGPRDSAAALAGYLGTDDVDGVQRQVGETAMRIFRGGVKPRDGARELVEGLQGRVPLAVATNSRRRLAEVSLASAGFPAFGALISVDDAAAPKPHPAPYRQACEALGADPARSVGLEDSAVGARSARDAGLWVIGCPSLPGTDLGAAHVVVDDLAALDPRILLGR